VAGLTGSASRVPRRVAAWLADHRNGRTMFQASCCSQIDATLAGVHWRFEGGFRAFSMTHGPVLALSCQTMHPGPVLYAISSGLQGSYRDVPSFSGTGKNCIFTARRDANNDDNPTALSVHIHLWHQVPRGNSTIAITPQATRSGQPIAFIGATSFRSAVRRSGCQPSSAAVIRLS